MIGLIAKEFVNTLYMVAGGTFFSFLFGMPLGMYLFLSDRKGLQENVLHYRILGFFVNMGRSLPFAIVMVAIIPFTRFIIGTSIGTAASIVPLAIGGIPFVARIIEVALKEVSSTLVEAALVMGATPWQILTKVVIPEALPAIVRGATLTAITLVGYSAMAGLVGGGGLGQIAIQYGYQRFNGGVMIVTSLLLFLLVEGIQWGGQTVAKRILKKRNLVS